jgi:hypothetical protein
MMSEVGAFESDALELGSLIWNRACRLLPALAARALMTSNLPGGWIKVLENPPR